MTRYIEFTIDRSDFDLDGDFALHEPLEIVFSTNLHGFQIESVRVEDAKGVLQPVPVVIADYIAAWSATRGGKRIIQRAYEDALIERDESRADDRGCFEYHQMRGAA